MSNKLFSILVALILLPVFGWMIYDFRTTSDAIRRQTNPRDVLLGPDESMAQIQYLFHFANPVYNHSLDTSQIEVLSHNSVDGERYRVYGLTQADYGTGTHYEVNWSKKWFKAEYEFWVENLQVEFSYNTLNVFVSSRYPEDSCEYRETLAHENEHVEINRRVYFRYQKLIQEAFAQSKTLPLSSCPIQVGSIEEGKKKVEFMINSLVDPVFDQFKEVLTTEHAKIDTPENYAYLKQRCSQW